MKNNGLFKFNLCLFIVLSIFACQQNNKSNSKKKSVNNPTKEVKINQDTPKIKQPDTLIFSDPKLSELVKETENLFKRYDTILPSGTYSINQLKLPKKLGSQLTSVETDSVNGSEVTLVLGDLIDENIRKILKWKGIEQYDLSLLFRNYIEVVKSPDGKLYSLFFDEKTGGSYRSSISYLYYITDKGTPMVSKDEVFNRDGYGSIDTIQTKEGIKYLLMGSVVGCNTCAGNYIDLVSYKKGKFIKEFNYVVVKFFYHGDEGTYDGEAINYNSKERKIYISYYADDLTQGCNCGTYGVTDTDDEYEENKLKRIDCVYTFNGKHFKLTKKKVTSVKPKP